jgi:ketosteroid isomerase-like protein
MQAIRKAITLVIASSLAWTSLGAAQGATPARVEERSSSNLEIVRAAFEAWAAGGTTFFNDVLAPDVRWTIRGSGPAARTYIGRENFVREAAAPLNARLSGAIKPTIRHLLGDGDVVIAVWDGAAVARDGKPYGNNFVWIFRMQDGKATEVEAFLDLEPYYDVLRRVPARDTRSP